jgi:hypothetical protein
MPEVGVGLAFDLTLGNVGDDTLATIGLAFSGTAN